MRYLFSSAELIRRVGSLRHNSQSHHRYRQPKTHCPSFATKNHTTDHPIFLIRIYPCESVVRFDSFPGLTQKMPEFTIKTAADAWSRSFFFARSPSLFGGVAQVARATVS